MILHIINKSPINYSCFNDCLAIASKQCSILFIEDGVYAACTITAQQLTTVREKNIALYCLKPDLAARGIIEKVTDVFSIIEDSDFVELITTHHTSQSWF